MRIALLSCTKQKKTYACKASVMYSASQRFALAYQYAKRTCDRVYILSSKYGLLHEDTIIQPYDQTLNDQSDEARKAWARQVLLDLRNLHSLTDDEYIIIAGMSYSQYLTPFLSKYARPLQSIPLGGWIPALNKMIQSLDQPPVDCHCDRLHDLFNGLKRYDWTEINQIPFTDGIYILFEHGEVYKHWDRIVRIGTHTADGRLKGRLKDHFIHENKDGSILRKNIGLALLKQANHPYIKIWNLDMSKPENIKILGTSIDPNVQAAIERRVTAYLRKSFTFTCFPVHQKDDRLRYEEAIISTLARTETFRPSFNWLGRHNPKGPIFHSGLWNYIGFDAPPLTNVEVAVIERLAGKNSDSVVEQDDSPDRALSPNVPEISAARRKVSANEIRFHIRAAIDAAKKSGLEYIDLVSGNLHRELGLSNSMPSVCNAMRQVMEVGDSILRTTPSGNSSTIMIRYFTSRIGNRR